MHPIARKDELIIQELAGELLVYDLKINKAICLNQTSALVWRNCDGKKTAVEIAAEMEKHFGTSVNEEFVFFALNQLQKENLLQNPEQIPNKFNGLSRREVIKRVGVASAVSLPIIASLVAPLAVHAQSCTGSGSMEPTGCPCTMNNDCSSNDCMANGMCA
jgi:hypothetical protein